MIDDLKLAISENDIVKARQILKEELLEKNCSDEVLKDALELASKYHVFEEHNDEILSNDPKEWTKEYLDKLKYELDTNFSKERLVKAYYVRKNIKKSENNDECTSLITINNKCKNFLRIVEASAAVIGAAAIGAGVYLLRKKLKK